MNKMAIHTIESYISRHLEKGDEFSEQDSWRRWGGDRALYLVKQNPDEEPSKVIHDLYFQIRRFARKASDSKTKEMFDIIADEIEEIGLLFV